MNNRERLHLLRGIKELAACDEKHVAALLPFMDEAFVPAGTVVAQEGRLCHQLVIVAAGELEACRQGRPASLRRGDAFGWDAMRERGHHDATVLALSPARLLVMSHEQFRAVEALALAG